jgi:hypothetical protein
MQLTRDYLRLKESIGIGSLGVAAAVKQERHRIEGTLAKSWSD